MIYVNIYQSLIVDSLYEESLTAIISKCYLLCLLMHIIVFFLNISYKFIYAAFCNLCQFHSFPQNMFCLRIHEKVFFPLLYIPLLMLIGFLCFTKYFPCITIVWFPQTARIFHIKNAWNVAYATFDICFYLSRIGLH